MQTKLIESIQRSDLEDATHIDVEVAYDKGDMSYFTGRAYTRGYYLRVRPVTRRNQMVSFSIYSGKSMLLLETKRFSEKQMAQAVELGKAHAQELVDKIVAENKAA